MKESGEYQSFFYFYNHLYEIKKWKPKKYFDRKF